MSGLFAGSKRSAVGLARVSGAFSLSDLLDRLWRTSPFIVSEPPQNFLTDWLMLAISLSRFESFDSSAEPLSLLFAAAFDGSFVLTSGVVAPARLGIFLAGSFPSLLSSSVDTRISISVTSDGRSSRTALSFRLRSYRWLFRSDVGLSWLLLLFVCVVGWCLIFGFLFLSLTRGFLNFLEGLLIEILTELLSGVGWLLLWTFVSLHIPL